MATNIKDPIIHLWSYVAPQELVVGNSPAHGLCGVQIGRFVSEPEKVTCPECINTLNSKEKDGPQAAG